MIRAKETNKNNTNNLIKLMFSNNNNRKYISRIKYYNTEADDIIKQALQKLFQNISF